MSAQPESFYAATMSHGGRVCPNQQQVTCDLPVMLGSALESPRSQCPPSPGNLLAGTRQEGKVSFSVEQPKWVASLAAGSQYPEVPR